MNDRAVTVLPAHLPVLGAAASQQGTKVIGVNQDPGIYRQSDDLCRSISGIEISGELRVTISLSAEMIQGIQQGLRGRIHAESQVVKERYQGTFNWSPSAAHTNDETLLIIESPQLAKHFTREMDRLWRGAELGVTARMQRTLQQRREQCGSGIQRG